MIPFSILKTVKHPPLAERIPLPAPLAIFLEFTNRCNFKCGFCPESLPEYKEKSGGYSIIPRALFTKVLSDIEEMGGIKVLRLYGLGETLLHPNAVEMITEACTSGIAERTELTTNGSMLTSGRAKGLALSGLDYVRVSIYGTSKESMYQFTQSPIAPDLILDNVKRLRDARVSEKPFIYVKMVTEDQTEIDRLRDMYEGIADEVESEKLHNWTGQDHLTNISRPTTKHVCPAPFYVLKVNSDGIVTCCDVDWQKKTAIGDVREESLAEIWNGDRMKAFRLMHIEWRRRENAACANCDFINSFPDDLDEIRAEVLG